MEPIKINGLSVDPNDHELIAFLRQQNGEATPDTDKSLSLEQQFIRRLQALRTERGMAQVTLAEKTGLPQSAIARIEAGKGNPTLKTLVKLADALGYQLTLLRKPE